MNNPLMPHLNNSNNSLFNIIKMLKSGDPQKIAMNLMQKNPQFRSFIEANKGKSPEQVAKEHGIDLSQFKNMM